MAFTMIDASVNSLIDLGFSIILEWPESKRPIKKNWTTIPFETAKELEKSYKKGMNYAVRLGTNSAINDGFLHVIDIDIKDSRYESDAFNAFLKIFKGENSKKYPIAFSGSGNGSAHIFFLLKTPLPYKKLAESKEIITTKNGKTHKAWQIELLGNNRAVTIAPSIHPDTKKPYKWGRFPTKNIPFLPQSIVDSFFPKIEENYEANHEIIGLSFKEAEEILDELPDLADSRSSWVEVGMALKHEFSDSEENQEIAWEIFDDWSKQGAGYNKANNRIQWDSFNSDKKNIVTMRSLIAEKNQRELFKELTSIEPEKDDEIIVENVNGEQFNPFDYLIDEGLPEKLLKIPGRLQLFVDWYNMTSKQVQPQFAVQTAIALGSVVLARHWKTDQNNFSSLYLLDIAPTSSGKEHVKKTIDMVLTEAGHTDLIGPKTYSSEAGVLSALKIKPRHISITDEFARYLASTRSAGNVNKQDMQSVLMEVFGRLDGVLTGIGYSTRGMNADQIKEMVNSKVYNPAITLMGMTTPDHFYKTMSGTDVADGFLNRFLIVESDICRQIDRDTPQLEVPKRLINWIKDKAVNFASDNTDGSSLEAILTINDSAAEPFYKIIPFSKEAKSILKQMARDKIALMDKADSSGLSELFGRSREIAMRISLIVALSCNHDEIKASDLEWARDYVYYYHKQMAKKFANRLNESDDDLTIAAIIKAISKFEKTSGRGMPESKISENCASFRKLKTYNREEIINRMLRDRLITLESGTSNTRGPATRRYLVTDNGRRRAKK